MSHDAQTFNGCVEMMSGWQYSLMLKLVRQPVCDQLLISQRLNAEDFKAKIFMKSVGVRSEIDRRQVGDLSTNNRRLLENLCN